MAQERSPREQQNRLETLIFNNPQEAQEFAERVRKKSQQADKPGVTKPREVLAEEIADEISKYGETANSLRQPWEHTSEEHREVQQLVDLAFTDDLPAALHRATKSKFYPRIIDLFHDVLTGEMYEQLVKRQVNKQKIFNKQITLALVVILVLTIAAIGTAIFL